MAIEVGDAIWRIKGDPGPLQNDLARSEAMIANSYDKASRKAGATFAENIRKASLVAGAAMTAAGAAITAFTTKAVMDFVETGSAINDMAARTGMGTTALQEFGYAAGLSGASMDDVEKAAKRMSQTIFGAAQEATAASEQQAAAIAKGSNEIIVATGANTDALAYLGLTYQDLANLSPEQQFTKIGFAIGAVQDATMQAALAQTIFGRSGTMLIPMLSEGEASFRAMAKEAASLGLIMSEQDVAAADQLGDTMDQLKGALQGTAREVASALAPMLIELAGQVREAAKEFAAWRDRNPELANTIIQITVAAGAVMAVLGPLLLLLPGLVAAWGMVSGAVTTVIGIFGTLAGAISMPVVAIVAAVAAVVAAAYMLWENWDGVKQGLIAIWDAIKSAFFTIWGPIIDAITWLANTGLGVLNKVGGYFGFGPVGGGVGMATGGTVQQSGWAVVGERGPELLQLPQGATVYDAGQTAQAREAMSTNNNITVTFGRDSVRSEQDIRDIERALTRIIGSGVQSRGLGAYA